MSMVTDTQRQRLTDPGRPEVCNVCQMHRIFSPDDYEDIWEGERSATTGCVATKKLLVRAHAGLLLRGSRALRGTEGPGPRSWKRCWQCRRRQSWLRRPLTRSPSATSAWGWRLAAERSNDPGGPWSGARWPQSRLRP